LYGCLNEGCISGTFYSKKCRLLNVLLFLTTKQKELQPFKPADLLPETKLILGNYQDSKKLSVTKNSD